MISLRFLVLCNSVRKPSGFGNEAVPPAISVMSSGESLNEKREEGKAVGRKTR